MKLASVAQMREMDRKTIEDCGLPSLVLMENAARCVVDEMERRFAPLAEKRVAVVCGKGNNGGDGLAVARHLATRSKASVTIWLAAPPDNFAGDAAANLRLAHSFGLELLPTGQSDFADMLTRADVIVDALLGTGLTRGADGETAKVIDAMNAANRPIVAVDVPSGLNADTGEADGAGVNATITITFALPKFGLLVYPGTEFAGELVVADIGMPRAVMAAEDIFVQTTEPADIARWLPKRLPGRDSNKGKFGHVTVFAGSVGLVGAACMTAEASARNGAGLTTLAVPPDALTAAMTTVSHVVMTRGLPFTPDGVEAALALAKKGTVAALGPGLGGADNDDTHAFVREFVRQCPVPLVIDADGLNALASEPDRGVSLVKQRPAPTILTPHPGEMARLLGMDTKIVQADRRGAVEQAAREFGCVVVLKGMRTLTADPNGHLFVNTTGNPGMATGGTGDVLTGVIAACLAQGLDARPAAACGVFLHGLAGDLAAAAQDGFAGLLATDLLSQLPRAIARCQEC